MRKHLEDRAEMLRAYNDQKRMKEERKVRRLFDAEGIY
jgi:hypothetical protein